MNSKGEPQTEVLHISIGCADDYEKVEQLERTRKVFQKQENVVGDVYVRVCAETPSADVCGKCVFRQSCEFSKAERE